MLKKLLSVGNCSLDDSEISRIVHEHFNAVIVRASDQADATRKLAHDRFDLVVVNRTLNGNRSGGVELIRLMKSDPKLATIPVMLLSNYPDSQQVAVAEGAELGFGKSELQRTSTVDKLRRFLG